MTEVNHIRTTVEAIAHKYTINLDRTLTYNDEFQEELYTIRNATEHDLVDILIASNGGSVDVMQCFLSAIESSPATITTHLVGSAASAATFIFLSASNLVVHENATMMLHEMQVVDGGTMSNLKRAVDHIDECNKRMINKYYTHFLTEEEINNLLRGEEMYLQSEDIMKRLEYRNVKLKEEMEIEQQEAMEQAELDFFGEPIPQEKLEALDKDILIRLIRGEVEDEEYDALFGDVVEEVEVSDSTSSLEDLKISVAKTHSDTEDYLLSHGEVTHLCRSSEEEDDLTVLEIKRDELEGRFHELTEADLELKTYPWCIDFGCCVIDEEGFVGDYRVDEYTARFPKEEKVSDLLLKGFEDVENCSGLDVSCRVVDLVEVCVEYIKIQKQLTEY